MRDPQKYSWAEAYRDPPRIPPDRTLSFGQMLALVCTVGVVLYGAAYWVVMLVRG